MNRQTVLILVLVGWFVISGRAWAELKPDEIAIVDVQSSRESRAVASYYAQVRNVPTDNIIHLDLPTTESISHEVWSTKARMPIRQWLAQQGRMDKIRCFVTVWDVPLKIEKATDQPELDRIVAFLKVERQRRIERLNEFGPILASLGAAKQDPPAPLPDKAGRDEIKQYLDDLFNGAQASVNQLPDGQEKQVAQGQLQSIYFQAVGLNMMMQSIGRQMQANPENVSPQVRSQFDVTQGRTTGLREGRVAMEGMPPSLDREPQLLALIQLSDGIFGSLIWIEEQVKALEQNESYASFDSELTLVAWSDYNLVRWVPNYLHYRYDDSAARQFQKTFMVSRLDAPTLRITRDIIDSAIAVEKTGLKGKVYLDARGLVEPGSTPQPGSYEDYDLALLKTHQLITQHTNLEVVLNDQQALFAAGEAPDAALYCGWYSLAEYVDAFDWNAGAVGYHMASAEAKTLHDASSQVWCKRMLEDRSSVGDGPSRGVVATLGPVQEPYITAFPRPNEFFACLLSGKYTLAESYFRTNPFNSWTMTLIGDPLYSPYRNAPPLNTNNLDVATLRILDGSTAALRAMFENRPSGE